MQSSRSIVMGEFLRDFQGMLISKNLMKPRVTVTGKPKSSCGISSWKAISKMGSKGTPVYI